MCNVLWCLFCNIMSYIKFVGYEIGEFCWVLIDCEVWCWVLWYGILVKKSYKVFVFLLSLFVSLF